MTRPMTEFFQKRWLPTVLLLALMVVAVCWDRGLESGLRTSAIALFVLSLMILGVSSVLSLARHQRFFTAAEILASLYAVGYGLYAMLQNELASLRLLVFSGILFGLVIGLALVVGDRLRKRSDEA